MLAIILVISLAVSLKGEHGADDDDHPFRNQEGDHIYYDKSIIEKKKFHRLHPKEVARTFRRLFNK